jgi:glycosyltransferase involved in cell wall biosynthesis
MTPPLVSVIIPVYNEQDTLAQIVGRVRAVDLDKEIIVVDDGSSDGTAQVLADLAGQDRDELVVLRHPVNQGKGAAIRTGLARVKGRAVIIQDGDLEYDPQDYPGLLAPILEGRAQVVYGSRLLGADRNRHSSLAFYWGGRLLTAWTNLLYGSNLTDEPTCYKAFAAELIKGLPLTCQGFEFCPEVTGLILKQGIPIMEKPISYHPRSRQEGKKIKARDGLQALWVLLRVRLFG